MVTVLGERAVTGAVQAAEVLDGVHHPSWRRLGGSIQVRWEWPPGLTQALVRWAGPDDPPEAAPPPLRVTLDGYRSRGVQLPACDGGCTVTITPLSTVPGCLSRGSPGGRPHRPSVRGFL